MEWETIKVHSAGDDQYKLTFSNRDGDEANFEFLSIISGSIGLGDNTGTRDLKLQEGEFPGNSVANQIQKNDMFILSDSTGNLEDAFTHIMQYKGNDESNNIMTFEDKNSGETVEVSYDSANASSTAAGNAGKDATIKVGGKEFNVDILGDTKDSPVYVDFNGNGAINFTNGQPVIVTQGRMYMNISLTPNTPENISNLTAGTNTKIGSLFFTWDEDLINDATTKEIINLTFQSSSATQLDLIAPTYAVGLSSATTQVDFPTVPAGHAGYYPDVVPTSKFNMRTIGSLDEKEERNVYGALFHLNQDTSGPDSVTITNPLSQAVPVVTVEFAGSTVGTAGGAGGETVVLNRIEVGAAKLASEVSSIWGQHSILVGGPCASTASTELLNNPADCTSGFEPGVGFIRLMESNGKYAMLVAGYSAADTRRATTVLANYKDYALSGTNVEVKSGINNQISVAEAPVMMVEEPAPEAAAPEATTPEPTTP